MVLDTNVFISAALKERTPSETAVRLAAASHLLLTSTLTLRELFVTLERPRLAPMIPPDFLDWLHQLMAAAELVKISERIAACRDPKDDKFLELAVGGRADVLATGDGHPLALNPFRGIPVVTPADFVQGDTR